MSRSILESHRYTAQLQKLGSVERLDSVLCGVLWSIWCNAESWPLVPGFRGIRLAKTDGYGSTARLRVWFRILDDDEAELLWVENDLASAGSDDSDG
jgi:hypothetical protein